MELESISSMMTPVDDCVTVQIENNDEEAVPLTRVNQNESPFKSSQHQERGVLTLGEPGLNPKRPHEEKNQNAAFSSPNFKATFGVVLAFALVLMVAAVVFSHEQNAKRVTRSSPPPLPPSSSPLPPPPPPAPGVSALVAPPPQPPALPPYALTEEVCGIVRF